MSPKKLWKILKNLEKSSERLLGLQKYERIFISLDQVLNQEPYTILKSLKRCKKKNTSSKKYWSYTESCISEFWTVKALKSIQQVREKLKDSYVSIEACRVSSLVVRTAVSFFWREWIWWYCNVRSKFWKNCHPLKNPPNWKNLTAHCGKYFHLQYHKRK